MTDAASFTIGDVQITRIEEVYGPTFPPDGLMPNFKAEECGHIGELASYIDPDSGLALLSVHSWLVQTPQSTILVDTCNGNHKERVMEGFGSLDTPWLDTLGAAGVTPGDVDYVVCTHLHLDHVGWNTMLVDGEWVPTFPNAKTIINEVDFDFWKPTNETSAALGFNANVFEDSVQPVFDRETVVLWKGDGYTVDDTLELRPATGHSPGQCVGWVESKGERALLSADTMHSPVQVYRPDWHCGFDLIPDEANATRQSVLEQAHEANALLMPAHFPAPHAFRVHQLGDGFKPVGEA